MLQDGKATKQKRAKVYKNSAATTLFQITHFKRLYFVILIQYTTGMEKSAQRALKASKKAVFPYYSHIIDNNTYNINTTRPCRAYIAYFKL